MFSFHTLTKLAAAGDTDFARASCDLQFTAYASHPKFWLSGQVDVFLPRYKEPWSLYGPVVQSALDINYLPNKLNVYVLDDGRLDPVKQCLQVCSLACLCLSCSQALALLVCA